MAWWSAAPLLIVAVVGLPALGRADGGRVLLSEPAGPFLVTVFAAPSPLRVGPADLSVLVQSPAGAAILDAKVGLELARIGAPGEPLRLSAEQGRATNRLLYAADADLLWEGGWRLRVEVARQGERGSAETAFAVEPEASPLARHWPWLAVVPVVIAVFLLHQWLRDRQSPRRRTA